MRDERKPEEHVAGKPTAEPAAVQEEQIEDLAAPAGNQEGVLGGGCQGATYIQYTFKDTL
jgi:hypothetical protein